VPAAALHLTGCYISKIEQRFQASAKRLPAPKMVEGGLTHCEPINKPIGYYAIIEPLGIAIHLGDTAPEGIGKGSKVELTIYKLPAHPDK
jgi:hypothetical protein